MIRVKSKSQEEARESREWTRMMESFTGSPVRNFRHPDLEGSEMSRLRPKGHGRPAGVGADSRLNPASHRQDAHATILKYDIELNILPPFNP